MEKKLISADDAITTPRQHTKPCSDCPWRRDSLPGWLGDRAPERWMQSVLGDAPIYCHVLLPHQCMGAATFRANICKIPRDRTAIAALPDRSKVFGMPAEFLKHHKEKP